MKDDIEADSGSSVSLALHSIEVSDRPSVQTIWKQHFPRLVQIAHSALGHLPHRREDAEDAAQSALISFWQQINRDGLSATLDGNSLWGLLATIAARKAQQLVRRDFALKRGGGNVVPFSALENGAENVRASQVLAHLPAGGFDLACEERLQQLTRSVRPFCILRLFGHTNAEIAEILGCSVRKVERKLQLIRSCWGGGAT